MYSSTVIAQLATFFFFYRFMFFVVFFSSGLFARQYIVLDVCIWKKQTKKMSTSVYCWCLCQVHLVGLVCLLPFIELGFLLALFLVATTQWKHCLLVQRVSTQPDDKNTILSFFSMCSTNAALTIDNMQTTVGVFAAHPRNYTHSLTFYWDTNLCRRLTDSLLYLCTA